MPRQVQRYVTELLVEILGPVEIEKRFDWCRGDSRSPSRLGRRLPFDAVWESRKLIVEVDERQHDEPVAHFDKPWRRTISGVHRGEQRRIYDDRKALLSAEHGYTLVRVNVSILARRGKRLGLDRDADRRSIQALLGDQGVPGEL